MRISITSISVDDQAGAWDVYAQKLGFEVNNDVPVGEHRWLTVVSKEQPDGTELLLEPSDHPAVTPYTNALVEDRIPATSFQVDDVDAEFQRLTDTAAKFTQEPTDVGPVRLAVFDDTCEDLIQLVQMTGKQR